MGTQLSQLSSMPMAYVVVTLPRATTCRQSYHAADPQVAQMRRGLRLTATEILLVSNSTVQFFDKQNGTNGNGSQPTGK